MGFVPFNDVTLTRLLMMGITIALIVISAISLSSDGSTGHLIVSAVILAVSALGFISLFFTEVMYASTYMTLLSLLCVWEIVFLLVDNLKYGTPTGGYLMWDIILCVLCGVGSCLMSGLLYGQTGSWMGLGSGGGMEYGGRGPLAAGSRSGAMI